MRSQEVGIAVTVPSRACCSAKIEEEVGAALGLPRGSVKFVVPLAAQLIYGRTVVELGKVVESLKERGCTVALERVEFKMPLRPTFLPAVCKIKVGRLSEELQGVVSASIDLGRSRIAVDYVPTLVGPNKIREALLHWGVHCQDSRRKGVRQDEAAEIHRVSSEPERVGSDDVHALHPLGPGVS